MRYAIIDNNNTVTNVAVSDAPLQPNWIASESAAIGDSYDPATGTFARPVPAPAQLAHATTVTRRQGLLALWRVRQIRETDIVDAMANIADESLKYEAQIEFAAQTWDISNPLIGMLAGIFEITPEQLQELFDYGATL